MGSDNFAQDTAFQPMKTGKLAQCGIVLDDAQRRLDLKRMKPSREEYKRAFQQTGVLTQWSRELL